MDEESVGIFGVLLIVTALVMSQTLQRTHAAPTLPDIKWQDVVNLFGCDQSSDNDCYVTANK